MTQEVGPSQTGVKLALLPGRHLDATKRGPLSARNPSNALCIGHLDTRSVYRHHAVSAYPAHGMICLWRQLDPVVPRMGS
jgi:hypothetical protein